MTTCSVTEESSTHNPASITPTPDQDGADTSKKKTSNSNFDGPMNPSQTPFTDIEENMSVSYLKRCSAVKRKICHVEETEGVELNPKKPRRCMESPLVDISPANYELNPSIIDYNFTGESKSRCGTPELFGASNRNSRCGTPEIFGDSNRNSRCSTPELFGDSNPNSRRSTPSNFRGVSYNLPESLGYLELNVGFSR